MILQSLVRLAERENLLSDPGYVQRPVQWIVDVDDDGRILTVVSTAQRLPNEKKERFAQFPIPKRSSRTMNVAPDLLVDNGQYLFGLCDARKPVKSERVKDCVIAFIKALEKAAEETKDVGVRAQVMALRRIDKTPALLSKAWATADTVDVPHYSGSVLRIPKEWASNHLFAFRHCGEMVCRSSSVRRWVASHFRPAAPSDAGGETCLVTGRWATPARLHDKIDLPGDTGPLPLVSFNLPAFEHYGREGNENAPVSEEAANAYAMALRRLLSREPSSPASGRALARRNLSLSADTTVAYWADAGDAEIDPTDELWFGAEGGGLEVDPDTIAAAYTRPRSGGRPALVDDPTPFFTLVLTRVKSRAILRSADLHSVGHVALSAVAFFAETAICPRRADERDHRRLRNLVDGTVSAETRDKAPAADLAARLFRAAIDLRIPYPRELLAAVVRRIRAHDSEAVSTRRAALARAVINRTCRPEAGFRKELPVALEPDHPSTAYQLGRLFAVLEKAQQEATDAQAGIGERFLGNAMASPALAFPRLLKLSRHHVSKIGATNPGREINLGRAVDEIISRLPPELPRTHTLVDQGTFVVGYHHQRAALWQKKASNPA